MIETKAKKTRQIKLPSDPGLINKNTLWKTIEAISETGETFTKDQLAKKSGRNPQAIGRILAYLKYLGVVNEKREKFGDEKQQCFELIKNQTIRDLIYETKAKRTGEARIVWQKVLSKSDLFSAIKDGFFADGGTKTMIDLENYLRREISGSPLFIQRGCKFIADLFSDIELMEFNGNEMKLINTDSSQEKIKGPKHLEENEDEINVAEEKIVNNNKEWTIKISGPNFNTTVTIDNPAKMSIVESTIAMIKKEIGEED